MGEGWLRLASALFVSIALGSSDALGVTPGQSDDFDGSTDGWQRGSLATPGPLGAADSYLRLDADGVSSGGNLVTFNQAHWSGDYLAAGVDAISAYVRNLGGEDLRLRLAFGDFTAPRLGGTWYVSSHAIVLAPSTGWQLVQFPVACTDLVQTQGSASCAQVLGGVVSLRILHAFSASAIGDSVIGSLGIDAVSASVPASVFPYAGDRLLRDRAGAYNQRANPKEIRDEGARHP